MSALTEAVYKNLQDKSFEKRKAASGEVHAIVNKMLQNN